LEALAKSDSLPGTYVRIEVSDTGHGIPPEARERMFDAFFTTKEVGKGTGFGLSTVQAVVKSHGGFITVESAEGRGTTFKIHLPANPSVPPGPTLHPFKVDLPLGHDECVLVVDDEFSIRDITQQTLEAFGYRVLSANNGAEAVALYARQGGEIDLVVTDIMMPAMDGGEMIELILRLNPSAKTIAVSGIDSDQGGTKAAKAGAQHFLLKPYTAETLLKLVREVLDRPATPLPR
jgi:CheY-like chemotaxis protein